MIAAAIMCCLVSCHPAFVPGFALEDPYDQNDKWGLVVMGLGCDAAVDSDILFVHWYAYDRDKQSIIAPLESKEPVGWTPGLSRKGRNPGQITYSVARLPPGNYVLGAATTVKNVEVLGTRGQQSHETRFFGSNESLSSPVPMIWSSEARSTAGVRVPRITVKAGEIIYIGDYLFEVDSEYIARLRNFSVGPDKAKEILKNFPNVHGEMKLGEVDFN
jgi:hypothetical protein